VSERYELGDVDVFTGDAVGRPGERTFYLQARVARQAVSVKCEKQQVAALAQYLLGVLDDLPAVTEQPLDGTLGLVEPLEAAFVLGPISVGVDPHGDRIVLQLNELVDTDDEGNPSEEAMDDQGWVKLALTRGQVLAFCRHATEVVSAGRPACRWCGGPMDPDGHPCPRMN
jgi:uncharacterized repeat protein (TIGR03847 family)